MDPLYAYITCLTLSGILDLTVGITVGGPVGFVWNYCQANLDLCSPAMDVNQQTYCGCMRCSFSSL